MVTESTDSDSNSIKALIFTLSVVGVVGVFVAKIVGHFRGAKGAKFCHNLSEFFHPEVSRMAVLSLCKVSGQKRRTISRIPAPKFADLKK